MAASYKTAVKVISRITWKTLLSGTKQIGDSDVPQAILPVAKCLRITFNYCSSDVWFCVEPSVLITMSACNTVRLRLDIVISERITPCAASVLSGSHPNLYPISMWMVFLILQLHLNIICRDNKLHRWVVCSNNDIP
jgi:hypothetical protein